MRMYKALVCCYLFMTAAAVAVTSTKPLYEFSNVELAGSLGQISSSLEGLKIGERVQAYALKSIGTPVSSKVGSDNLNATTNTAFINRCLALAVSGNWNEYYAALVNLNFRHGSLQLPNQNYFILVDWPETAKWIAEDVTAQFASETITCRYLYPKTDRRRYLYDLGLLKHYNSDLLGTLTKKNLKAIPPAELMDTSAQLRSGDILFQLNHKEYRHNDPTRRVYLRRMGVVVIEEQGLFVATPSGQRVCKETLRAFAFPAVEPQQVRGFLVFRPKSVSQAVIQSRVLDLDLIPDPQEVDRVLNNPSERVGGWFNISDTRFSLPPVSSTDNP